MQKFHQLLNYRSIFKIASKGRVLLIVSALLGGVTLASASPTGGVVTTGSANIASIGAATTITQSTNKASINWQSFSIAPNETVNFVQPSASSVTLNRVVGATNSLIQGTMNANGQVFLINPNGIIFSKGSSVNVGGIVVSTLNISDKDFQDGNYRFNGTSSASVLNMGTITAKEGGYVAMMGKSVDNEGVIQATLGNVQLAGASDVTLNLNGNSLLSLTINQGTLNALVKNGGIIKADGGEVYLTTKALSSVLDGLVNNTGVIQAQGLANKNGHIVLFAHGGEMQAGGTLTTGKSTGDIETSAQKFVSDNSLNIITGNWLLDPTNLTIDTTLANSIENSLLSADVTLTADFLISVNAPISWNAHTLTLSTGLLGSIEIDKPLNLTNTADLALQYGLNCFVNAPVNIASTSSFSTKQGLGNWVNYTIINSLGIESSMTGTDLQGINGNLTGNYVLGTNINTSETSIWNSGAGFTPIGDSTAAFSGYFNGLGHTISNLYINSTSTNTGLFGAMNGATILNIGLTNGSVSGTTNVGALVGYMNNSIISNSYASSQVTGNDSVGGLLGHIASSMVTNSFATGDITGRTQYIGGLIGWQEPGSTTLNSFATGNINASSALTVGGLVGLLGLFNSGPLSTSNIISNSYATGNVYGNLTGGLVGWNQGGAITKSYATGNVVGTNMSGGFVGRHDASGTIDNSYATGDVQGSAFVGGFVGENGDGNVFIGLPGNGDGYISDCYSTGDVQGTSAVGGFAGANNNHSSITRAYSTGHVPSEQHSYDNIGGFIGESWASIYNSFFITTTNASKAAGVTTDSHNLGFYGPQDTSGVKGLTTEQMRNPKSFSNGTGGWFVFTSTPGLAGNNWVIINSDGSFANTDIDKAGSTLPMLSSEYSTSISNAHQLQLMALAPSASYILGTNVDASSTSSSAKDVWLGGSFVPIGMNHMNFTGTFDGLGHAIDSLTINLPSTQFSGLFSYVSGAAKIQNVGLTNVNINGETVGALVGMNDGGTITNTYSTGSVTSNYMSGGLVGDNYGTIANSYSTTNAMTGGLVAYNGSGEGIVTNSFWNMNTSSRDGASSGSTGLTDAQMTYGKYYSDAGWTINVNPSLTSGTPTLVNSGGVVSWQIAPLALSYTLSTKTSTYNGQDQQLSNLYATPFGTDSAFLNGDYGFSVNSTPVTSYKHAGTYDNIQVASNNNFLTINSSGNTDGSLTINPITLTPTLTNTGVTKTYDGTTDAPTGFTPTSTPSQLLNGDSITLADTGAAYNSKDVITANQINVSGLSIASVSGNALLEDYVLGSTTQSISAAITPIILIPTLTNTGVTKIYDGTTAAPTGFTPTSTPSQLLNGDSITLADTEAVYNSKDIPTANKVTVSGLSIASVSGNAIAGDYVLGSTTQNVTATITPIHINAAITAPMKNVTATANNLTQRSVSQKMISTPVIHESSPLHIMQQLFGMKITGSGVNLPVGVKREISLLNQKDPL